MKRGFHGKAIYTVPTRALANDKLLEWRNAGWNVGITTGDISDNVDAPIVVATLETQKQRLMRGDGPDILVIDEYQMLGDTSRGVNYELAIALAPPTTQLLLMSGSVENPRSVVSWLKRLERDAKLIATSIRPIPLEEVHLEALRERVPDSVRGFWPRAVAKTLLADMGPVLLFAPRRAAAENFARQFSAALPLDEPLMLTPEQKKLAGPELAKMLRNRIAYHHSGLSYSQRAGLIEPLAKTGQLRVVVATTGLGAGVNFSLRSVIVTDREYRAGEAYRLIRPDELKQMFGRAGRRGLDKAGYVLVAQGKPRLNEARSLHLRRTNRVDWPSLIGFMQQASEQGEAPLKAARRLTVRLFSEQRVPLGLEKLKETAYKFKKKPLVNGAEKPAPSKRRMVIEILNSKGLWERRRAPQRGQLGEAKVYVDGEWLPVLRHSDTCEKFGVGRLCKLGEGRTFRYGRELSMASISHKPETDGELVLTKAMMRAIKDWKHATGDKRQFLKRGWTLERLEAEIIPLLPHITKGGMLEDYFERNNQIVAKLDYSKAQTLVYKDQEGTALLRPPERERDVGDYPGFRQMLGEVDTHKAETVAEAWLQLGLINEHGNPTRRGIIFSYFNHGEGLAIAAALEDETYTIEEIVPALANLRAGHRFSEFDSFSSRLGNVCRITYQGATFSGYLNRGVPDDYGDGAAEVIQEARKNPGFRNKLENEEFSPGDLERAILEWRSLLNHITHLPDYDWDRWLALKDQVWKTLGKQPQTDPFANVPKLTPDQQRRYKRGLKF